MNGYFMKSASSFGGDIDWLFNLITILVGFWFLVAQGTIFYFLVRYRRKDGVKAEYVTGELKHEKRWISIPHALVIFCDVFIIYGTVMVWHNVKQTMPPAQETIRIVAQQWGWIFVDPGPDRQLDTADDISTVDQLHVKVDTVYQFELQSKDVIHSFSVPAFRLKQDVVPGRVITGWFKPTMTGQFDIQCSEMCGIGHGIMAAQLTIETPAEHERWMNQNRS